jgi:NAD(P)-dependent dehydrogenase (short-subunit alcohol dehydrogenase family)
VIVTGASSGIGERTALRLAQQGMHVVLACRSLEKTDAARRALLQAVPAARVTPIALELGSLAAVRQAASAVQALPHAIDVLINNAGTYCTRHALSEDGIERTMAVNYLGPMLLSLLLCDRLAAGARILFVSSNAHRRAKSMPSLEDPGARGFDGFQAYARSKLALVMGARALAEELRGRGIGVYSLHPGHASTNIWPREGWGFRLARPVIDLFLCSADEGAEPSVHLATTPVVEGDSGSYFDRLALARPDPRALDPEAVDTLWNATRKRLSERSGFARP